MKPQPQEGPVSVADQLAPATIVDLGMIDYGRCHHLQQKLVERRRHNQLESDLFLITEHPATFTLGRRGGRKNLVVSEQFLKDRNIPVISIERGGDITFHGPGQLVIYPIYRLRDSRLSVADYVYLLEEAMIQLADSVGVRAMRDERNHGVWVEGKKLGSVGIAIRHGISFHGLALNVNVSLEPFSWVNPCGLHGVLMTSLSNENQREVTTQTLGKKVQYIVEKVFSRTCDITAPSTLFEELQVEAPAG